MSSRLREARARQDRGAVLTEFALLVPLFALLAMGIAEFGLAWRDSMTVATGLRSTARVAANMGSDRLADYEALRALDATFGELDDAAIEQVVIFNAGEEDEPRPGCKEGKPSSADGFQCNVYTPADFARPAADFSGEKVCNEAAVDRHWCPLDRSADQGTSLDTVGVWVRVRRDFITGLFPGDGLTIEDGAIMRVEPGL